LKIINGFALDQHLDTRFDTMSLGTQKKFLLTAAFIGRPAVFIADEPSNGLDVDSRALLIAHFCKMRKKHVILITSHDSHFLASTQAQVLKLKDLY
jgi:ATPase subunit of ABC transporter with duplicated ATPase domains